MKNFRFEKANQLSRTQSIVFISLSIAILIFAFVFEVSRQYETSKNSFNSNIDKLLLEHQQVEQRANNLLESLSQYYLADLIKTKHEFEDFAKGLYKHNMPISAIGFAKYQPREQPHITKHSLSAKTIAYLDRSHAFNFDNDLFQLPGLFDHFQTAAQANSPHIELFQSDLTKQLYSLTLKPLYLNNPNNLSQQERQKQVIGAVFIILPIEQIVLHKIQTIFSTQEITLTSDLPLQNNALFRQMMPVQQTEMSKNFFTEFYFDRSLPLVSSQPKTNLNLIAHWRLKELKVLDLFISLSVALMLFLGMVIISTLVYRYTQHLKQTQNRLQRVIETSQDAVIVINNDGYIQVWNPVSSQLFGYSEQEALSQCIMHLIFDKTEPLNQELAVTFGLNRPRNSNHKLELRLRTRTGKKITAEVAISILNNPRNADNLEISLFIKDMTYQRQTEAEIKQLAYFDPLTNLENRTYFKSQLEQIILEKTYDQFALLFLDLDGFKQVNDSLGHSIGDELLIVISKRIVNTLRESNKDTHVCRFGGDEFVLMLGNVNQDEVPQITLRLLKQIERLVKFKEDELKVSGSIGIALYPQHGNDVDTLLRHADTAMYHSKDSGKNTFSIYNDVMEERLSKRLLLEKHLRNAQSLNELTLVYQPKIDILTGKVVGVEALIRWNNPILGFVPPDEFIPIAEESNLIIEIGDWVAEQCIEQLRQWQNTTYKDLHIAINVSGQQLQHPDFLQSISSMMKSSHLSPSLLEIELTERTIMSNAEENINRFNDIRAQGFELSVDDFGTGYSSLSYLKKFPLSILKIDKSFVDGLPLDDEDVSIAKAILSLAHNLNMRVVAEGVETPEQLAFLKDLNCNLAQGYYISRPLSPEALETWLSDHKQGFYSLDSKNIL